MNENVDRPLTVRELLEAGPDEPLSELFHRAAEAARKSVEGDLGGRMHDLFDALHMRLANLDHLGIPLHQINCPLSELERLADAYLAASAQRAEQR